ncbi:MAG: CBS domain-containing protein [Deltaproteobacteria bacterium]|nr:CBS domain-containing protein [Deltaproteobacteria bacterium]
MATLVKDVMNPIEEYDTVDVDAHLCDALAILKRNHENQKAGTIGKFHKTIFVTDASKNFVGKISMYDLIRGLVPENVKKPEFLSARALSSRALAAAEEAGDIVEHFQWENKSFADLVKQEAHKKVRDIMTPITGGVLTEDDKVNHAIYVLFKDGVRQQLVLRDDQVVGVLNLMVIMTQFLDAVGPECYVEWE